MTAIAKHHTDKHEVRFDFDAHGYPVRVYIGAIDVTHLIVRMQTNRSPAGVAFEVVLRAPPFDGFPQQVEVPR